MNNIRNICIRSANNDDLDSLLLLIKKLARYEGNIPTVTYELLSKGGFGDTPVFSTIVALENNILIGYAIYYFKFSAVKGSTRLYLEDLYVSQKCRGSGAGKALLKHLAKLALSKNCGRFEWSVLDWNQPAIGFYDSIGAKPKQGWIGYQLAGDALERFGSDT